VNIDNRFCWSEYQSPSG